jgi:hypothetical protein
VKLDNGKPTAKHVHWRTPVVESGVAETPEGTKRSASQLPDQDENRLEKRRKLDLGYRQYIGSE